MKLISNSLEPLYETWEDPGDYPSNAGQFPLPSYTYFAGLDGEVIVDLCGAYWEASVLMRRVGGNVILDAVIEEFHSELHDILSEAIPYAEEHPSIQVQSWSVCWSKGQLKIEAFEAHPTD